MSINSICPVPKWANVRHESCCLTAVNFILYACHNFTNTR